MDKIPLWIVVATTALLSLVLYVGYASLDSIMSPIFYAPVLPLLLFVMLKCVDPEGVFGMLGTVVAAGGGTGAVVHPVVHGRHVCIPGRFPRGDAHRAGIGIRAGPESGGRADMVLHAQRG